MASEFRFRITTNKQFEAALDRIAQLVPFKRGTPEYEELTILLIAVIAYKPPAVRRQIAVSVH